MQSLSLVVIFATLAAAYQPSVQWGACPKDFPAVVQCGTIDVPMDHADPDGDKITLALALLKANQTCDTNPGLF